MSVNLARNNSVCHSCILWELFCLLEEQPFASFGNFVIGMMPLVDMYICTILSSLWAMYQTHWIAGSCVIPTLTLSTRGLDWKMTLNEVSSLVMRGEAQLVLLPALGGAVLLNQMGKISVSVKLIRLGNRLRCAVGKSVCTHACMC